MQLHVLRIRKDVPLLGLDLQAARHARPPNDRAPTEPPAKDLMLLLAIVCLFASAIYWWGVQFNPHPR